MFQKLSVLSVLLLILLSACSSNTFTFTGETKNWSAELKVTQHSNDYEDRELELHYKGDISSVEDITFNVETNAGGFSGSGDTLDKNGRFKSSSKANPTNAKIIVDAEVEVTVEWNDNTETIMLSNNSLLEQGD